MEEPSPGSSGKAGTSAAHNDEDMAAHGDVHAAFRDAMGLTPGDYRPRPRVIPPAPSPAAATPQGSSGKAGGAGAAHDDEDMAAHSDAHAAFRDAMGLTPGDYRPRPRVIPAAAAAAAAAPATPAPANQFDLDESDSD